MKPKYQIKQDFMNAIKKDQLHKIKLDYKNKFGLWPFEGIRELIKTNDFFRHHIVGELLPTQLEKLGNGTKRFCKPKNFLTEALWVIEELKLCRNEINNFIDFKEKVEQLILWGKYEEARDLLKEFNRDNGYSLWALELELLSYCLENDLNTAFEFQTSINTTLEPKDKNSIETGFVRYLLYWLFKRSMPNVSPVKYDFDLLSYEKRNKTTFDNDKFKYFLFRLNYFEYSYFDDMTAFPIMESPNSIYDRYLSLCNLVNSYFCFGKSDEKKIALEIGEKLYNLFKDSKLISFSIIKTKNAPSSYFNKDFIDILDAYYRGDYILAIEISRLFLSNNYPQLDVIKIYCRSLLFLDREFVPLSEKDSPINKIATYVYDILSGEITKNERLAQIHKKLYAFDIAFDLDCFLRQELINKDSHIELKLITNRYFDPYFLTIFDDENDKLNYLEQGLAEIPDSLSISYHKGRFLKSVDDYEVVSYIKDVDRAKIAFENKNYDDCLHIMNSLQQTISTCTPVVQTANQYIFNSLLELGKRTEAYTFFVNSYLHSPSNVSKTNTKPLIEYFARNKYKGERLTEKYVLFVLLNAIKPTDKSYVLESFLRYNDCDLPSKFLEQNHSKWNIETEILFYHILDDDILRHMLDISSTLSLLKERKKIVDILCTKAIIMKDRFDLDRQQIEQELDAYNAARNDDESKIYANVPAIIKYEGDNLKALFDQLETLYKVTDASNRIWIVKSESLSDETIVPLSSLEQPVDMTDNVLVEISLQIFDVVKNLFLKSRFGIGTYLSTRIRHGVFEGEIRSVFEKCHLALSMENNKYVPDPYWKNVYGLSPSDDKELMDALTELSEKIDSKIKYFKQEVIQIKTKSDEKGMIDFSRIPEEEIFQSVISSYTSSLKSTNQFEQFIKNMIDYLWGLTGRCLTKIRNLFETDSFNSISAKLLSLNNLPILATDTSFSRDFKQEVNKTNIELDHVRIKVQHWFNTQDVRIEKYKLCDLIQLSWDTCRRYHPGKAVLFDLSIEENDRDLPGSSRIHLTDVFRTVFTNMILYCKKEMLPLLKLEVKIEDDRYLNLRFSNNIDCDEEVLNEKLYSRLRTSDTLQREGGSGLVKIQKIIKYDLACEENEINVRAANGEFITEVRIDLDALK